MGNPKPLPVYWDKILINASQVTNPSIDPLREPMETKTFLGQKPSSVVRDENGNIINNLTSQLKLEVPIMFSAMSFGSISKTPMKVLQGQQRSSVHTTIPARAVFIRTFINTDRTQ